MYKWEHGKWPRPTIEQAFWSRANKRKDDECWFWGGQINPDGYGVLRSLRAHRFAYELLIGGIPEDKEIDHLCSNRNCVNPKHMEVVTHSENNARSHKRGKHAEHYDRLGALSRDKRFCPQGHPYTGDNLCIDSSSGARRCKICNREKTRRYLRKKAAW